MSPCGTTGVKTFDDKLKRSHLTSVVMFRLVADLENGFSAPPIRALAVGMWSGGVVGV